MARWSRRERSLLLALVLSYACVFPVNLMVLSGRPDLTGEATASVARAFQQQSKRDPAASEAQRRASAEALGGLDGEDGRSRPIASAETERRRDVAPTWTTSGGAPTAHIAALTAYGGSLTHAYAVPIWTRVMGQTNPDDGPGGASEDDEVRRVLGLIRQAILTQYREHVAEFREKAKKRLADAAEDYDAQEGAAVNNRFFEWQQQRDVDMLGRWIPCVESVKARAAQLTTEETRARLRGCDESAMQSHWTELYGTDEYKQVSRFIRNSLRTYMAALGITGNAESRGTTETTPEGEEILWTWASVHSDGSTHPVHDHPDTLIAGTFYVHAPADAGHIVFHDPRRAIDPTIGSVRVQNNNIAVKPVPGMVVLFPPWLQHEVEPTHSGEERIAISFNLRGDWRYTSTSSVLLGHGLGESDKSGFEGRDRPPEPFIIKRGTAATEPL